MIQHVYERCATASVLSAAWICTDDLRIYDAVQAFGGNVVMTRSDHISGTDRAAEAAGAMDADIIVNIQGDQPFMHPAMIEEATAPLLEPDPADVSTMMFRITREEDLRDPAVVKVVVNKQGRALYFSRSLIPYPRENTPHPVYEHAGIYAYRKETLLRLTQLAPTSLERVESLEQLRWLENGLSIAVTESHVPHRDWHGFSVDTAADLERAEQILEALGKEMS